MRNAVLYVLSNGFKLLAPPFSKQAQVHAQGVQRLVPIGHDNFGMQHAALFAAVRGDVEVVRLANGEFGQHGIAMVAIWVNRIFAVTMVIPNAVRQKLHLTRFGVQGVTVFAVQILYFLQENQVGFQLS